MPMPMLFYMIPLMSLLQNALPQSIDYDGPVRMSIFYDVGYHNWTEAGQTTIYNLIPGKITVPRSSMPQPPKQLEDGSYVMRLKTLMEQSNNDNLVFYTFVKSQCDLLHSPIVLYVNLDHAGTPISSSALYTMNCNDSDEFNEPTGLEINFVFRNPEAGPVPDTASYINRLDKEREAKEKGATQDNRSFLGKYWMYIVPVVLFVLISGSANSDVPAQTGR